MEPRTEENRKTLRRRRRNQWPARTTLDTR
ncbi:hypothetical protein [Caudoviricetes sp.]|nr:hypothetical protein [Caudoviricetes sp.]UOF79689.1 hypothetical protein [Caudoviricetes sp.]UOF79837.1 hypothetical protein [Bacteriophage sp.]UOF81360.1 hypothetical protein [Caudoviricetes sp.]